MGHECSSPGACGVCHVCQRQQPCPIHPPQTQALLTWPTVQDLDRLHKFLDKLNTLTAETGIALGICSGCDELKLYDLKPGITITYQLACVDHLFVDIPDTPCAFPPEQSAT